MHYYYYYYYVALVSLFFITSQLYPFSVFCFFFELISFANLLNRKGDV